VEEARSSNVPLYRSDDRALSAGPAAGEHVRGAGDRASSPESARTGDGTLIPEAPVVLFDGDCALCHHSVRFVLRHERSTVLRFLSLQGARERGVLEALELPETLDSMVLIEENRVSVESEAALRLSRYLKAPLSWLAPLAALPDVLHRPLYRWIARNRLRWFGAPSCELPDPEQAARFLD